MAHKFFSELYNKMPLESRANVEQRVAGHKRELERKIVVPLGMLEAASGALAEARAKGLELTTVALEAALKWLGENPICPTQEQKDHLLKHFSPIGVERWDKGMWFNFIADCAVEWQRMMFLAPNPPDEPIKDLLWDLGTPTWRETEKKHNTEVWEAYNRGLNQREVGK